MSARHRHAWQRSLRPAPVIAGVSAAGMAALFAIAPLAHAEAPQVTPTDAPADPGSPDAATASTATAATPSGPAATPSGRTAATGSGHAAAPGAANQAKRAEPKPAVDTRAPQVEPNYGTQKIRVGVQTKSDDAYPVGTTTAGTTLTITETGPGVGDDTVTTCETDESTAQAGSTATYCFFPNKQAAQAVGPIPFGQGYFVQKGDTVTVTQTSVNAHLLIDAVPQTVGPCVNPVDLASTGVHANAELPICPQFGDGTTLLFTDPGIPPEAVDNTGHVRSGGTVNVDVLKNDDAKEVPATIGSVTQPSHGTATIVPVAQPAAARKLAQAAPSTAVITYTSKFGFVGKDTFTYTIKTDNGTARAKVTIDVVAPPPTAVDDRAATTSGTPVKIGILGNDSAHGGGALTIDSVGNPSHGSVRVDGTEVVYTSAADFAGTDTFVYTISTRFGTDTATVTVTVTAPLATAATGSQSEELLGLSLALLIIGGAATVAGRRRYHARHVPA
jgi:hypothetical protein